MTSTSSAQDSNNASQSDRAGSPSAAGTGSPLAAATAKSTTRSYANAATKSVFFPPPVASSSTTTSSASESLQNGNQALSNGKMAAPAIVNSSGMVNGASAALDHTKKPSVTISAAGTSGYTPNGGPIPASGRPNISFGQINQVGTSPSVANSVPSQVESAVLSPPPVDPRITTPDKSPSPIPQPANSGGLPPSGFQAPGNVLNFGSMGGNDGDVNRQMQGASASNATSPVHLRRQSSQSAHGDPNNLNNLSYGQGNRGSLMPGAGRGRMPSFGQGYQPQPSFSPNANFRSVQRSGGSTIPPHFHQGQAGPPSHSPHLQSRTPGYQGSPHGTPQMQHSQMNPQMHFQPQYPNFQQHLSPQAGHFAMQPQFDPNFAYYGSPYSMPPQYLQQGMQQGPSSSPRQYRPGTQQSPYVQGQYNQSPAQSMSRSASQVSERPPSASVNHGQQQQPPAAPQTTIQASQTPTQAPTTTPAQNSNFTIPPRVKKGLIIKRPDGEIVTFDKVATSPAPAPIPAPSPSPTPAVIASTPPPRSSSIVSRSPDTKPGKTVAEIKAEFLEQVKKGSQEDKAKEDQEAADAKAKDDKAAKDKEVADAKAANEIQEAETAAAKKQEEADQKAAADKAAAEKAEAEKAASEKAEADRLASKKEADEKAQAEADKAEAEKLASEKADAQKAEEAKVQADQVEADKAKSDAADKVKADKDEEQRLKDEEFERMIAEMEAADKADAEREAAFSEKKRKAKEEQAAREKEAADNADARMKQAERDAEALEEARQNKKPAEGPSGEAKEEAEKLFASLKKPTLGPGAEADDENEEVSSSGLEDSKYAPKAASATTKPKPLPLKLDTIKPVEPAQMTPGMQSLKSARMLNLQSESVTYPEGIQSPNPALVQGGRRAGRLYDKEFLLQFREVFKEKPSVDWDARLKESVGDASDTGAARSARTPSGAGPRSGAGRPPAQSAFQGMGTFGQGGGARTLPPGTTSTERFNNSSGRGPTMNNPLAQFANRGPGAFPMGTSVSMSGRQPPMGGMPKQASSRGGRVPSRNDRQMSKKEEQKQNHSMPMTAGLEIKSLEVSSSGWKGFSVGRPAGAAENLGSGHLAPDLVQRKVKAALNKMTPERFDKIADQILVIAAQSKDEADGRTLRQVIQLTFDKACDEAHWASMYAKFCLRMMEEMSSEIKDETITDKAGNILVGGPLFRKYLLNRCQEEFERGWTVNMPDKKPGETDEAAMLSDEYYIAAAAKRKGLGLVQFIGELYKLRMLSVKIMHQCFLRLLNFDGMPDESAIESLTKLLRAVGSSMQQEASGPNLLDTYFNRVDIIMNMEALPSRMHFMLLDIVDLRKAGWHSKDDSKGPKTLQEIHDEAALAQQQAEAQRAQQNQRGGGGRMPAGRGDARNFSGPMAPPDYQRNQVATDDLRRLGNRRQASTTGPARTLGPSSMFSSRSNSGRPSPLGPPVNTSTARSNDSGMTSRTASRNEEVPRTPSNAFSLLENLDASGEHIGAADVTSPVSPTPANAEPATDAEASSGEAAKAETTTGDDEVTGSA